MSINAAGWRARGVALGLSSSLLVAVSVFPQPSAGQATAGQVGPGDWPQFLYNPERQAWNPAETALSPATAPALRLRWKVAPGGGMWIASPAVVGDTVYEGSWDGNEYALNTADGSVRWKTEIGTTATPPSQCKPPYAGVTSGAAVGQGRVYVGGGAEHFYALDAATGAPVWSLFTGPGGADGGNYNWASPLLAGNRVYSGIASFCDHPLVRGYAWGADAATGANQRNAYIVREGTVGGGIWTSPTLDAAHNRLFVTTGTPGDSAGFVDGVASIDLGSYTVTDGWRVPPENEVKDADFGTTPTLVTLPGGKQLVVAGNKNGIFYAQDADHLAAGPVWQLRVAEGGECPQCGEGTISSGVYHDGVLYLSGGSTTIDGVEYPGATRAVDAATGTVRWVHTLPGPAMGSAAGANGVLVVPAGHVMDVIAAEDGRLLFRVATEGPIWGAPSIAHGVIYLPSTDGFLYAYEVPPELVPVAPPVQPTATPRPAVQAPAALAPVAAPPAGSPARYFPPTAHTLAPPLRAYWERYGGLAQFGYPLTEPFTETVKEGNGDQKGYLVQYFERARFEYHPEYAGSASEVLLGLLGTHFHTPAAAVPDAHAPGGQYLNGHNLGGAFLRYWQAHGGLFVNGYPISEAIEERSPTDGKIYTVQYFERARMEYHPEYAGGDSEVLLGLLGTQLLQQRGWLP
jgi:outer membrane protein assembly factor BamB